MFTIGDIYWTEFLAFIIGCGLTSIWWLHWGNKYDHLRRVKIAHLELELSRYTRKRNELGRFTK